MARWASNSPYVNIDLNVSNIYLSGDYPNITFHFDCDFNYYCPDGWASMSMSNINFNTQITDYATETKTENVSFNLTAGQESARYGSNYYNPSMGKSRQRTVDVHAWVSNGTFTGGGWTTVTSPAIPAPSAYSISSITNITERSVTVSHVLTNVRNYWYVNLYDEITGKYWNLNNDTGNGTTTITGLNPNQTYRFRLRVLDRNYNYCYQAGGGIIQDTTTLGKSSIRGNPSLILGKNLEFIIDGFSDDFRHTATFKVGSYSFSRSDLTKGNKTITPKPEERDAIYAEMTTVTSKPMSISLATYTKLGSLIGTTTASGTVEIDQSLCRPVVNSFSYKDSNSVSVGITGNNQYLIQNLSTVQVTSISATAKNKASMTEYWLDVDDQKIQGTTTTTSTAIVSKAIAQAVDQITVRAKDSRGLEGFLTKTLPSGYSIPYQFPQVKRFEVTRKNQIEEMFVLTLEAAYTPIKIGTVNKNSIVSVKYRYKLTTSTVWGSLYPITCTTDATAGTIKYDKEVKELDVDKSYDFEIQITDKGGTTTSQTILVMGKPVMSLRKSSIGINKVPETGRALDVEGAIYTDGYAYAKDGFLPNATGGSGYVGNSSRPFNYGYFKNIYKNGVIVPHNNESPAMGTGNDWTYLKFPNGTLMQYRRCNVSVAYNTWLSGQLAFAYLPRFNDFALAFTTNPMAITHASLNIQQDCYITFIDPPSTTNVAPLRNGASYTGYAMSSDPDLKGRTQTFTFEFFALGRWK